MKKILLLVTLISSIAAAAHAKPLVVATTADMASITRSIAGDLIELKIIYTGNVDLHFFEPRPFHVVWVNKADMLIVAGLDADEWVYPLLNASRNPKIQIGKPGFIDPSAGVKPMNVPDGRIDGSMGHVHEYGNPHYWLDEDNLIIAAENIARGLTVLLPDQAGTISERKQAFIDDTKKTFSALREKMSSVQGMKIIQFHESWDYFCRECGMVIAGSIEPKPGVPPTPGHISDLKGIIATEHVEMVIAEPYYSNRPIKKLVDGTTIKVVRMPLYLQGEGELLRHIEKLVDQITTEAAK
ncbi:MAG: zinc ABC transporter substrate-binding protein [Candidatus Auribacter fodinae]|jgi:ABC-type Zn uptake system ZnuABC Zn-binding protein ZnuA|uniref:Zinc ABC transporter substrate-binding protein n=1 Tax=Candidatus Auribacter fodinae TaxID=2093366 RepID=A0A3A4RA19_9BACT|nr:MAG: zinc ABC transporter substrate-binding protein [Candidatus Auribacter fodinae]